MRQWVVHSGIMAVVMAGELGRSWNGGGDMQKKAHNLCVNFFFSCEELTLKRKIKRKKTEFLQQQDNSSDN